MIHGWADALVGTNAALVLVNAGFVVVSAAFVSMNAAFVVAMNGDWLSAFSLWLQVTGYGLRVTGFGETAGWAADEIWTVKQKKLCTPLNGDRASCEVRIFLLQAWNKGNRVVARYAGTVPREEPKPWSLARLCWQREIETSATLTRLIAGVIE